jgi:hypothetical protein
VIEGLFMMNILDAFLTLANVSAGKAWEANMLPKMLLEHGPIAFLCVKIGVVTAALAWAYMRVRSGKWKVRIALPILSVVAVLMLVVVGLNVAAMVA